MKRFLHFLQKYHPSIVTIIALLTLAVGGWQYLDTKKIEQRQRDFENYHRLIEKLNVPPNGEDYTYLDIQKAVIFELRNYPEYKTVTREILTGWIERKSQLSDTMKDTLFALGTPYQSVE